MDIASFRSVLNSSRPLTQAAEYRDADTVGIVSLRLTFGDTNVFLTASDLDELICSNEGPVDLPNSEWDASTNFVLWRRAIGKPIRYVWSLRNHRGYDDGLQIEFGHPDGCGDDFTVQALAIAARLSVRLSIEVG